MAFDMDDFLHDCRSCHRNALYTPYSIDNTSSRGCFHNRSIPSVVSFWTNLDHNSRVLDAKSHSYELSERKKTVPDNSVYYNRYLFANNSVQIESCTMCSGGNSVRIEYVPSFMSFSG